MQKENLFFFSFPSNSNFDESQRYKESHFKYIFLQVSALRDDYGEPKLLFRILLTYHDS